MPTFVLLLFQSHAGSIEAQQRSPGRAGRIRSFNPTLVRLRHSHRGRRIGHADMFQSHAGSIEAPPDFFLNAGGLLLFQSHAGSIEARSSSQPSVSSTQKFQSHAGSIEARFSSEAGSGGPSLPGGPDAVSIPRWFD